MLPPAGHEERPLPDAWRAQHRSAYDRGARPLRHRPPHARLLLGRDGRPAPRRHCVLPSDGRSLRLAEAPPHRWAWAASAESVESRGQQHPDDRRQAHRQPPLGLLRVSAAPREIFQRPTARPPLGMGCFRHFPHARWTAPARSPSPSRARASSSAPSSAAPPSASAARSSRPSPLGMGSFPHFPAAPVDAPALAGHKAAPCPNGPTSNRS